MKKLLYFEGLPKHVGHIPMNQPFMEIFSKGYEVHTLCLEGWYRELDHKVIQHTYLDISSKISHLPFKVQRTVFSVYILKEVHQLCLNMNFDIIIMSTFSYWVTLLWPFYFKDKNQLWILHHDDLDLSKKWPYKWFFRLFVKRYIHLTLEWFISIGMKKMYPEIAQNIFELTNPYRRISFADADTWDQYSGKMLCICIGRGADDSFMNDIIAFEKESHILEDNEIYLYFKSQKSKYKSDHIVMSNAYLTDAEYSGLIKKSSVLFICYEESYHLRLSGQLLDGLSSKKYVIGKDIPIIREFEKRYPHICRAVASARDFVAALCDFKNMDKDSDEFARFLKDHSDEKILKQVQFIEEQIGRRG